MSRSFLSKSFFLRTGFIAAIAVSALAGAASLSYAATRGGSPTAGAGPSGPSGPSSQSGPSNPGTGNGGQSLESRLLVAGTNCPPTIAATRCGGKPRLVVQKVLDIRHCDNLYWRHVMLPDGSIVEDHSRPMRKYCQVIPLD